MTYIKINGLESKQSNKSKIFYSIYQNVKIAKQDIAYSLKISLPTVTQNLKELKEQNLIKEVGVFESAGGRRAKAITFVRNSRYAIGLDITKNHVSLVLINISGEVLQHKRILKTFYRTHEYFQSIGELILQFKNENNVQEEKFLGVGISIPGILDAEGKKIAYSHALGISNVDCREFTEFIPYPCKFCNDANAAGIAEMWNNKAINNVAYLSLSNSVGGSIIIDKRLYLGDNQRSGEFGHMTIVPDGRQCYCGKRGCVDAYCSAYILTYNTAGNLDEFFQNLKNGDEKCRAIFDEYLKYLAVTINNLRMLFDCDVIVGGYVGSYLDEYIQILRKMVAQLNTFEQDGQYLKACAYKLEASAVGAALQHIDAFIYCL
jgi:predicted NBD/HSP70 family sugar kinase/nucleoid DNA-binding protein